MSFIPQRISVGATPAIGASITGGGSVSGRVAYFDSNTTITGDSTFTFDGTTVQARGFLARYDNNGVTRIQVRNDNAGASAFAQFKLSTDAGDFNINANSTAAGDSVQLTADSTFGGGMDVGILGANALRLRTAGTAWLTISGTGPSTFAANVTVESSAGPQLTLKDGGTIGTNADPYLQFNDTAGLVGAAGFLTGNSKNMSVANYTDTGSLFLSAGAAVGLTVESNRRVTIGGSGETEIHRFNTDTAVTAGAAGSFWRVNINGTNYKVQLYADS